MVLPTTSAQYAFLQVLASTYVSMLNGLQSATCITNPSVFQDCTDTSDFVFNIPQLSSIPNALSKDNYVAYYYSEYVETDFYGFSAQNFSRITSNLTSDVVSILTAACAANSTCTTSYQSISNAAQVVQALAATNVNTIQYFLSKKAASYTWIPTDNYAFLAQIYTSTPFANDEVYGVHDAVVRGIALGTINATSYVKQENLGVMMYGGAAMYDTILQFGAIGSYSTYTLTQSNVNLTGTQVYTKFDENGIGSRAASPADPNPRRVYATKWDVWKDEAAGIPVLNKADVFARIKELVRSANQRRPSLFEDRLDRRAKCTYPSGLQDGITWLSYLTGNCSQAGYLNAALSPRRTMNAALKPAAVVGFPSTYSTAATSFADVLAGRIISLCASGAYGYPCYPGPSVWAFSPATGGTLTSGTVVALLADVKAYSNPTGPALGTTDLYCAVAPTALKLYQQDFSCCATDCLGASCQSSVYGCTQGTGSC